MTTPQTKSELSPARRRLLELLQQINFGQIEHLVIRAGDPVFDPEPRVVHEIKFCAAENGPRAELAAGDFRLKGQLVELFRTLDALGDATVERLEVKHGLPFRLIHAKSPG
jgi:hypothetical protein